MRRLTRLFAPLRRKRGFTLIEVILGMTVSTIILLGVAVMISTYHLNYINSIELSYSRIMANNIADAIKDQLATAQDVKLSGNTVTYTTEFGEKTIVGGNNPKIEGLTYDPDYYMSKTANVSFSKSDSLVTVTVSITNKYGVGMPPFVMNRNFRLLNEPTTT